MEYLLSLYLESRNVRILANINVLVAIVNGIARIVLVKSLTLEQRREATKRIKINKELKEECLQERVGVISMLIGFILVFIISLIPILNLYCLYKSIDDIMIIASNKRIERND